MKPWEKYKIKSVQPMTEEQRLSALDLAKQIRPQTNKTFGDSLSEDMADLLYGADRAISGATLGGYDWLKRKTGLGLNQDDYLAMKEYNEGSALPAQVAGFTSEVGGNILGGGGAIAKGLMNKGLTGLPLLMASGGLESAVYGATGSDTLGDLPKNVAISGSLGTAMPVAFKGIGAGVKKLASPFIPSMATKGLKGGLENVVENPDSIRLLNRGIKSSDDVANEVLLQSRPVARDINKQSANMIDDALTSRIDVPEAIRNANARYGQYMDEHGADEVFDFTPTKEQLLKYPPQSKFNKNLNYSIEDATEKLRQKAEEMGATIYNDDITNVNKRLGAGHFKNIDSVRSINKTISDSDLSFSQNVKGVDRDYFVKKFDKLNTLFSNKNLEKIFDKASEGYGVLDDLNSLTKSEKLDIFKKFAGEYKKHLGKYKNGTLFGVPEIPDNVWNQLSDKQREAIKGNPDTFTSLLSYFDKRVSKDRDFVSFVIKQGDQVFNQFDTDMNYISNILNKNPTNNASVSGYVLEPTGSGYVATSPKPNNNIPYYDIVVNPKLPHVNSLYDGLNPYQAKSLKGAIARGGEKLENGAKLGSVDHLNKIKQDINAQIGDLADKPERAGDVRLLEILKHKVDDNAPTGLKSVDKGYEKAKRLESAFDRGTHYNPNNVEGADYISELSPLEKNAFTQGLFKRINNNSLANKNLAKTAMDYDNTLADVLSSDKYNELTRNLNKQSVMFDRLAGLGRKAESKLNTPEAQRFFGREQLESKGSLLGSALDLLDSNLRRRYYTNAGKYLLNPNYNGELSAMGKVFNSADALANYLSTQNPLLGSGLSATALRNLTNGNN